MSSPRAIGTASVFLLTLCVLVRHLAAAEDKPSDRVGPLVLKVNGRDVKLQIASSSYILGIEDDDPVGFDIDGDDFTLGGEVDWNGDGKLDARDKPRLDADGGLKPTALLNKTVIIEATEVDDEDVAVQNSIELPGVGKCDVLKGSTLVVTKYKKTGREVDRWSGTIKLRLKAREGLKILAADGHFECGIRPEPLE